MRKTFAVDALRRHEDFRNHVPVPGDALADFVAAEYPDLETRRLSSLNRTRFDVNLESTRTRRLLRNRARSQPTGWQSDLVIARELSDLRM